MRPPPIPSGPIDDNHSGLPDPLSQPDADLRSYDWFPLHHKRLIRSDFWNEASGEVAKASVYLWCEAMQQVPAGSLPNHDRELSGFIGFGRRDMTAWHEIRTEVLAAWVLCSDGRIYHPTLCEIARGMWDSKRHMRAQAAERQRRRRERLAGQSAGEVVTSDEASDNRDTAQEIRLDETILDETKTLPVVVGRSMAAPTVQDVQKAFDLYNELANIIHTPMARSLTPARAKHLRARLDAFGMDGWIEALENLKASDFCQGHNRDGWKADLDFLCQPKSFMRLIEGFYGPPGGPNGGSNGTGTGGGRGSRLDGLRRFDASVRGNPDER